MDIDRILDQLRSQREQLDKAIAALSGTTINGRGRGRRGGKRQLSAAGRRAISLAMKRRWAERRKTVSTRKSVSKAVAKSPGTKQETA